MAATNQLDKKAQRMTRPRCNSVRGLLSSGAQELTRLLLPDGGVVQYVFPLQPELESKCARRQAGSSRTNSALPKRECHKGHIIDTAGSTSPTSTKTAKHPALLPLCALSNTTASLGFLGIVAKAQLTRLCFFGLNCTVKIEARSTASSIQPTMCR